MKRGLGFYLRIYSKILVQDIKSKMSYRADFIISTIGMICTNIARTSPLWMAGAITRCCFCTAFL